MKATRVANDDVWTIAESISDHVVDDFDLRGLLEDSLKRVIERLAVHASADGWEPAGTISFYLENRVHPDSATFYRVSLSRILAEYLKTHDEDSPLEHRVAWRDELRRLANKINATLPREARK